MSSFLSHFRLRSRKQYAVRPFLLTILLVSLFTLLSLLRAWRDGPAPIHIASRDITVEGWREKTAGFKSADSAPEVCSNLKLFFLHIDPCAFQLTMPF
jgi:hypothetical protein